MSADKQELPGESCCCASPAKPSELADGNSGSGWGIHYFGIIDALAVTWWVVYSCILTHPTGLSLMLLVLLRVPMPAHLWIFSSMTR